MFRPHSMFSSSVGDLRIVDVNKAPVSTFFAINLCFDAAGLHMRSVFSQCCLEDPVKFRPRSVAVHVNQHIMNLKVPGRKHAAHYIFENMLLDGIEAVLFTQRVDKRNIG
jgi:hypothetical protein